MDVKKYCSNCGREIPVDASVCPYCGIKQDTRGQLEPSNDSSRTKVDNYILWSWICAVIALFIPLIGIVAVVLGVLVQKSKRDTGTILIAIGVTAGLFGFCIGLAAY